MLPGSKLLLLFFFTKNKMLFSDYVEEILNTAPKDSQTYLKMNKVLIKILSDNIFAFVKSIENGAEISTKNIKVNLVEVKPQRENMAIYSNIDYKRAFSYIEFYNEVTKRAIRIILSTTGQMAFVIGFYLNYTKNTRNNHFCKEAMSANEFFTSVNMLNSTNIVSQISNFLLAITNSPFEEQANSAISNIH